MGDFVSIETYSGEKISYKGAEILPFVQSFQIRVPWINGGLVWNRPVSVLVKTQEGQEAVIPIQDITRQVVWSLLGATFFMWLFLRIIRSK